jgi:hypothetical protein
MGTLTDTTEALAQPRTRASSPDAAPIALLLHRISSWLEDGSSVEALASDLEQVLEEAHFSTRERHAQAALAVARLHDTIDAIGGMTMNERLVVFDLNDRWDRSDDGQRGTLYEKLLAYR